jgi:HEAT repeat protein
VIVFSKNALNHPRATARRLARAATWLIPSASLVRAAAWLAIVVSMSGCHWLGDRWPGNKPLPLDEIAKATKAPQANPSKPADVAAQSLARAMLTKEDWIRTVRGGDSRPGEKVWRWRHAGVEELLGRTPAERPDFHPWLADEDPIVSANAAIALAHQSDGAGLDLLTTTVRAAPRRLSLRCAAIEAMANIQPVPIDRLGGLLDRFRQSKPSDGTSYVPELHAEVLAALAPHVEPATNPRFQEALGSGMIAVRLEAIRAWRFSRQPIPPALTQLRFNADARIRTAFLSVLGERRPEGADEWLIAAVNDQDLQVRLAALAALGQYGGDKAQGVLKKQLESRYEVTRAAAVAALDALGDRPAVTAAVSDRSWEVRLVVAQSLARRPDHDASILAFQLLDDPSVEVQRRMLASIRDWPLPRSGPLLLSAMERPAYQTRRVAAQQLAAQWPPAAEFPVDAPQERRSEVMQRLRTRFRQEIGFADQATVADALKIRPRPGASVSPESMTRVERLVEKLSASKVSEEDSRQVVRELGELGPELVPALEHVAIQHATPLPEVVYRDVLPLQGPVYSALARLDSAEVNERRRGAATLADTMTNGGTLPRLATARLVQRVATETDSLVWVSALSAVSRDPSEDAIRLAYAGVGHPSPEVRRRACLNLAAFPDPKHAKVLLPALDDSSHSVTVAAVQALGTLGHLDDLEPLRRQLTTPNESFRFEVAIALARLNDPAGLNALERLAYSSDFTVRRQAAAAMGDFADRQFIPALITLLADRPNVRNAALESLRKIVGPEAAQIEGKPTPEIDELVQRWKRWHRGQSPADKTSNLRTIDLQVQVHDTP